MSTVAICIPTYNQADYVTLAIESAFAQTYPNVQVWVSDDCSTDATAEKIEALKQRYPQIRSFRQAKNSGISGNNNWLLAQPQTDYIVRLDSDDLVHPLYVEKLVALLEKYPQAGYAHCSVREIDEHGKLRRVRRVGGRSEYQEPDEALRASAAGYRVAANICMFRASILKDLDYYRVEVEYVQDWDFSVRAADAGWGNAYCEDVLADYRVWEDTGKVRPRRKQVELEGCVQVYEDVLIPAFKKRGWDGGFLTKQRQAMALRYGIMLDSPLFTPAERKTLSDLLSKLGDSTPLRLQSFLLRIKLGPLVRWRINMMVALKDVIKGFVRRRAV